MSDVAAKNNVQRFMKVISYYHSQANVRNPLHVAAENNVGSSHYESAETLLNNGADPNAKDSFDRTSLWYLVQNCNFDMINLFSRFKADFTCTDVNGSSLLTPATKNFNNLDVLKYLVEDIGLDINNKDRLGETPLHNAARRNQSDGHYEMLKYLLENGADVNTRDYNGLTPIFYLLYGGNLKFVELFFKHNADLHSVGKKGENILFSGIENVQVLEKLLKEYPDLNVNHQNVNNETPLHIAINRFNVGLIKIEVLKGFLKNGANVNATDKDGVTPLIKAVRFLRRNSKDKQFLENIDRLDILIDQTDFTVAHKNANIFDYYFNRGEEDVKALTRQKHLDQWILKHLAKLKFLNIEIHPIVMEIIDGEKDLKDFFSKCTEELEAISDTKIQNCWITFFNLLVDSKRKLKNYCGNEDLIRDYEKKCWPKMFPIYRDSIKKNVEKGLRRRELFDESSILLSNCLPIFGPKHLIVNDILDCIMSKKDLSKFCE